MKAEACGVTLHCDRCEYIGRDAEGYEIAVPITVGRTDATVRLRCSISDARHDIRLIRCETAAGPADAAAVLDAAVPRLVELIGRKRLCGNEKICPVKADATAAAEPTAPAVRPLT